MNKLTVSKLITMASLRGSVSSSSLCLVSFLKTCSRKSKTKNRVKSFSPRASRLPKKLGWQKYKDHAIQVQYRWKLKRKYSQQMYTDFVFQFWLCFFEYSSAAEAEINLGKAVQSTCIFTQVPSFTTFMIKILQKYSWCTIWNTAFIAVEWPRLLSSCLEKVCWATTFHKSPDW